MKHLLIAVSSLALLTACQADPGQNRYNYNEVGQSVIVEFASIVGVKEVEITGRNTGGGALAGAAVGAGAGSYAGSGSGEAWAMAGGAVAGAVAGAMAEQALADRKGYEYIVVTEHKATKTIVQYQNPEDRVFRKGERVMVQTKGSYQRVLPTDDLPDTIKRPRGINITE
jgi:outer membrane lipoprotein SlyB